VSLRADAIVHHARLDAQKPVRRAVKHAANLEDAV
jgi:hypothetical protein